MEVFAAFDPDACDELADDRDHLQEIQELLQRTELDPQSELDVNHEIYEQMKFDLCPECRKKFLRNPVGRDLTKQLDFSKN
jgi:hypothetical protein